MITTEVKMSSINSCRKSYLVRYRRELLSLQKLVTSELEEMELEGLNIEVSRSIPGVCQEVARLSQAVRVLEDVKNYE
jgi:hypothetical protein